MGNYRERFENAVERTRRYGLADPHVRYEDRRFFTAEFHEKLPRAIHEKFGNVRAEQLFAQCLAIHLALGPVIARLADTDAYLTLGWFRVDDWHPYKFDDQWIAATLQHGISGTTAPIHAWLTLPSMEIIDLSIGTTIAIAHRLPKGVGEILAHHADELKDGAEYVPMLIGDDFLRRAGMLAQFAVLR